MRQIVVLQQPLREFSSQIHLALLFTVLLRPTPSPERVTTLPSPREGTWAATRRRRCTMGGGSGVGGFEEDTLSPHPLQQTEEAFLEGVLGGAKPPLQRTTSAWGEAQQLRAARRELSLVVDARLGRCVEACTQETASAAELRAALKAAAAAAAAARDADLERRQVDDRLDAALDRLGAPVEEDASDGDWVGANRLEEAISTAKAAGRAEALEALGERERLREKCELYRQRIEELENNMEDVALDETVDAKLHHEVVARLETAEKKLRCLMGTERGRAIAQLETELEERDETIAALREALDLAARPRSPPPLKPAPVDPGELALDLATQAPPQPSYLMRAESRASEVSFDSDGPATPSKPSTAHLLRPVPLAGETHHRVIQVAGDTFVV